MNKPPRSVILLLTLTLALAAMWGSGCGAPPTPAPTPQPQPTAAPTAPPSTEIPPTATPGAPTPTATIAPTETPYVRMLALSFTTEDDVTLSGMLFGVEGEIAVILAHMGTIESDQTDWYTFATLIAQRGFTALAFDFRGRGQSGGMLDQTLHIYDMRAAIRLLHRRGYERIVCMGASMGGTACLKAATEEDLAGLVVLASTTSTGSPTNVSAEDFPSLTMPKLFICAENDRFEGLADAARQMFELSPEPKQLVIFPDATAHGTELFGSSYGEELTNLLVEFLEEIDEQTN